MDLLAGEGSVEHFEWAAIKIYSGLDVAWKARRAIAIVPPESNLPDSE